MRAEAVLRRRSQTTPLVLVGVTLDNAFYPRSPSEATGPLMLTKGLVALAPLGAIDASHPADSAAFANVDAGHAWAGLDEPVADRPG